MSLPRPRSSRTGFNDFPRGHSLRIAIENLKKTHSVNAPGRVEEPACFIGPMADFGASRRSRRSNIEAVEPPRHPFATAQLLQALEHENHQ